MLLRQSLLERSVLLILGAALTAALCSGGTILNFYLHRASGVSSALLLSNVAYPPSTLRRRVLSDSSFPERQHGDLGPTSYRYENLNSTSHNTEESTTPTNPQPHCHHRHSLFSHQRPPPLPGKKGIGLTLKVDTWKVNIERIKQLNVSWNYSWNSKRIAAQPDDVEFLPMIWGSAGGSERVNRKLEMDILPEFKANRVHRLLPFNEPDNPDQSNLAVDTVVNDYWPMLEKINMPLASPSVAHATGNWTRTFFQEADKRCLAVQYTAVHWYGGANAQSFKDTMIETYRAYGKRPLLITEFAVANWDAEEPRENKYNSSSVLDFMKETLPWLQNSPFVFGYAWFNFSPSFAQGTSSALYDDNQLITACGRYYASVTPENPTGDQSIMVITE